MTIYVDSKIKCTGGTPTQITLLGRLGPRTMLKSVLTPLVHPFENNIHLTI